METVTIKMCAAEFSRFIMAQNGSLAVDYTQLQNKSA